MNRPSLSGDPLLAFVVAPTGALCPLPNTQENKIGVCVVEIQRSLSPNLSQIGGTTPPPLGLMPGTMLSRLIGL
jgi:hypothetical protein